MSQNAQWVDAVSSDALAEKGKIVAKLSGKQILIWQSDGQIFACNNRCPHEGYPLSEGTLSDGCVLTCNWHNWKFNLESGETLVGGDALRLYPVRTSDGTIQVDVTDPPAEQVQARAIEGLRQAFDEHDYDRFAREVARFELAGGDALDCLVQALDWAKDTSEFGTTHAQAAAPDWLALRDYLDPENTADRLVPVIEIIGHLSWDALQEKGPFPFSDGIAAEYDAQALEDAIEAEDEDTAVRQVRAGLAQGGADLLRAPLERASLRHYQSFGHTPIYLDKSYDLIRRLGRRSHEALILPLVRAFCMGRREDLIPEFRPYGQALTEWDGQGDHVPDPRDFRNTGVKTSLSLVSGASRHLPELLDALFHAASDAMLHFDPQYRHHTDKAVQHNIDWLDFTHALTHLNAAKKICRDQPALWPNALLQTGCFLGRNTGYVDWDRDVSEWQVDDPDGLFEKIFVGMLDHGEPVYIFPAHVIKVATALREEMRENPKASWIPTGLAALNRFVHEPIKRKHARRTANQALGFVRAQG